MPPLKQTHTASGRREISGVAIARTYADAVGRSERDLEDRPCTRRWGSRRTRRSGATPQAVRSRTSEQRETLRRRSLQPRRSGVRATRSARRGPRWPSTPLPRAPAWHADPDLLRCGVGRELARDLCPRTTSRSGRRARRSRRARPRSAGPPGRRAFCSRICFQTNSIAPTSSPRVGCAAIEELADRSPARARGSASAGCRPIACRAPTSMLRARTSKRLIRSCGQLLDLLMNRTPRRPENSRVVLAPEDARSPTASSSSTRPCSCRSSGMKRDAGVADCRHATIRRCRCPSSSTIVPSGVASDRSEPQPARAARCPRRPATPTISPARTSRLDPVQLRLAVRSCTWRTGSPISTVGFSSRNKHRTTHHHLGELRLRCLAPDVVSPTTLPAAQDRDAVGDLQHLVELVADEHDRLAGLAQASGGCRTAPGFPAV